MDCLLLVDLRFRTKARHTARTLRTSRAEPLPPQKPSSTMKMGRVKTLSSRLALAQGHNNKRGSYTALGSDQALRGGLLPV